MKNPAALMFLVWGVALFVVVNGACHKYEQDYYQELGCKPKTTGLDGCATSYDCSSLSGRNQQHCHYRGRGYDRGHKLETASDFTTSCLAECRCGGNDLKGKNSKGKSPVFSCVNIECPELFNGPAPEGCYRTYEHSKCCYVDEICVDEASQKTNKPKCEYKGDTFQEGQKFYPDEEPCLQCICLQGFNGSLVEPYCRKVQCNLELLDGQHISEGCVPVFYGMNGCCPIDWRCPDKNDYVVSSTTKSDSKTTNVTDKCQFGNLTLSVGETLSPSLERDHMECVCRVPPHPVCIQTEYSSED